ncbi:MAG: hypothetical protein ABI692_14755 [Terracoccus sp.]
MKLVNLNWISLAMLGRRAFHGGATEAPRVAGEEVRVRWDRLFDDLEAQLELEDARELDAEVADRTRRERAQLDLQSRLLANQGAMVQARVRSGVLTGVVADVGPDWLLLELRPEWAVLVALAALRSVTGLTPGAVTPTTVARRFALGAALRAVSRDRATVALTDVDARVTFGTIDVVGADHLEIAEHASDEVRRASNLVARHLVPFAAIESVRRLR